MWNIQFLPIANKFTRNIVHYKVERTFVQTIGKNNFDGMIWLEDLILVRNQIETLHMDTFQGLKRLKFVDLGRLFVAIIKKFKFEGKTSNIFMQLIEMVLFKATTRSLL